MSESRDDGASAVEYGLIVAAICAVLIVVVYALGFATAETYDDTCQRWARREWHSLRVAPRGLT